MMKKSTTITGLVAALCLGFLSVSCGKQRSVEDEYNYTVTCTLAGKQQHDSATLLVMEEEYDKLRVCGGVRATGGKFTFKGQTQAPRAAIIRWDNDTTQPFYFVLEAGNTGITIKDGAWDITGSKLNSEYLHYINRRNDIMNARVATWQQYLKMAADKSLTRDDERHMVSRDSILNDSLQRLTVDRINRGDAVGRIIGERYGGQLDKNHMRMLKTER